MPFTLVLPAGQCPRWVCAWPASRGEAFMQPARPGCKVSDTDLGYYGLTWAVCSLFKKDKMILKVSVNFDMEINKIVNTTASAVFDLLINSLYFILFLSILTTV